MRGAADQVKRLSLELGGHAPFIVFPDADPEVGAKIAVIGKFRNNGQVCIAPSRFYVHKDVQKKFTEAAVEFAKALKLGNGLDAGIEIGPMFEKKAHGAARSTWSRTPRKRGAKVLTGGKRSDRFDKGYFFEPTVLTNLSGERQDDDRGAVRPGDAAAGLQQARRRDRAPRTTRATAWRPTCSPTT